MASPGLGKLIWSGKLWMSCFFVLFFPSFIRCEGEIRLVDGYSSDEGRVEIFHEGQWGTVCFNAHVSSWDDSDARVVCRQLGYSGNIGEARSGGTYGQGSGPIHLNYVDCFGYESQLTDCYNDGWGNHHYCGHSQDVGVYCGDDMEGDIRLVDGYSTDEGRVEIFRDFQWGTVCDDGWDDLDARVVCRQLGYLGNVGVARSGGTYGQGSDAIHLDNVGCSGYESRLADCYDGWFNYYCGHSQDAGVYCGDDIEGDIRLVDGYSTDEGRVEIFHDFQWGTVCDDGWDDLDARVVCRQLGYSGSVSVARSGGTYGQGSGPIYLDNVGCSGYESRLTDCSNTGWDNQFCVHSEDAGVQCEDSSTQPTVKTSSRVLGVMASVGVCLSLLTTLSIIAVCWTCSKSKTAVTPRPLEQAIPLNNLSAHPAGTSIQTATAPNGNSGVACQQTMRLYPHDANLNPRPLPNQTTH